MAVTLLCWAVLLAAAAVVYQWGWTGALGVGAVFVAVEAWLWWTVVKDLWRARWRSIWS